MKQLIYLSLLVFMFEAQADENAGVWYDTAPQGKVNLYEQMLWQQKQQPAKVQPMQQQAAQANYPPNGNHQGQAWVLPPEWQVNQQTPSGFGGFNQNQAAPTWSWNNPPLPNNTPQPLPLQWTNSNP